jgi:hypothetical protein
MTQLLEGSVAGLWQPWRVYCLVELVRVTSRGIARARVGARWFGVARNNRIVRLPMWDVVVGSVAASVVLYS